MAWVRAGELRRAVDLYLGVAYPNGAPAGVKERVKGLEGLGDEEAVPEGLFEVTSGGGDKKSYALRLGQPIYPHMKLMVEACPGGGDGYVLRADAHDSHLHAPEGSPDAGPLAMLRASNKEITEKIEARWAEAGLPTFREYLRKEVERRRAGVTKRRSDEATREGGGS